MPCPGSGKPAVLTYVRQGIDRNGGGWACPVCDELFDWARLFHKDGGHMIVPGHGKTLADSPWIAELDESLQLE